MDYDFGRFLRRQESVYENALRELKAGKQQMQYLLFIFPRLRGLAEAVNPLFTVSAI